MEHNISFFHLLKIYTQKRGGFCHLFLINPDGIQQAQELQGGMP